MIRDALLNTLANLPPTTWLLFGIVFLIYILRRPFFKGLFGEFLVNIMLKRGLNKDEYRLYKNVTLPVVEKNGKESTTQIDHIVVSPYGVFVIETKNYTGWIFGSEKQKSWTQKIYRNSFKFQNPLFQNYKHTKALESLLALNEETVFSVIVFIGSAKLKTEMPAHVTVGFAAIKYIRGFKAPLLNNAQVETICSQIVNGRPEPSNKTYFKHVSNVKEILADIATSCPKCGSDLVERVSKRGENAGNTFMGCSSFPKCRYVG
jgi:restriction system protein